MYRRGGWGGDVSVGDKLDATRLLHHVHVSTRLRTRDDQLDEVMHYSCPLDVGGGAGGSGCL